MMKMDVGCFYLGVMIDENAVVVDGGLMGGWWWWVEFV